MITFTVQEEDRFFKMQIVNEIRNHFNYLIRNTRNDQIKYFSNIELGDDNPHVHIQLFYDDAAQVLGIYDKVIDKFGLDSDRCVISEPESDKEYSYAVKEYMDYSTETLLDNDEARREYRDTLGVNLRFISQSSGIRPKAVYRRLFCLGVSRENVDEFFGDVIDESGHIVSRDLIFAVMRVLVQVLNKTKNQVIYADVLCLESWFELCFFEWWIFGFPDSSHIHSFIHIQRRKYV